MDFLHEPLTPILRHILATADLPRSGRVLDLASGVGLKLPLLAQACGPDVTFIALDRDRKAIAEPGTKNQEPVKNKEQSIKNKKSEPRTENRSPIVDRPSSIVYRHCIAADAHALPLADGCCAAACCIAALSLFADPAVVLRELRRVVQPGGTLLVVAGTQAWAYVTRWPDALADSLAAAYAQALASGAPAPTAPDLGDDLAALLDAAGWHTSRTRAFLLNAADPVQAELSLLPWPALRPLVAARLDPATLAACDEAAAHSDIELCTLVIAAHTTGD